MINKSKLFKVTQSTQENKVRRNQYTQYFWVIQVRCSLKIIIHKKIIFKSLDNILLLLDIADSYEYTFYLKFFRLLMIHIIITNMKYHFKVKIAVRNTFKYKYFTIKNKYYGYTLQT